MTDPIVSAELHLDRISDKRARDVLRQAARDARNRPVWIVNRAGQRIGAIVTPDDAGTLMHFAGPGDGVPD